MLPTMPTRSPLRCHLCSNPQDQSTLDWCGWCQRYSHDDCWKDAIDDIMRIRRGRGLISTCKMCNMILNSRAAVDATLAAERGLLAATQPDRVFPQMDPHLTLPDPFVSQPVSSQSPNSRAATIGSSEVIDLTQDGSQSEHSADQTNRRHAPMNSRAAGSRPVTPANRPSIFTYSGAAGAGNRTQRSDSSDTPAAATAQRPQSEAHQQQIAQQQQHPQQPSTRPCSFCIRRPPTPPCDGGQPCQNCERRAELFPPGFLKCVYPENQSQGS